MKRFWGVDLHRKEFFVCRRVAGSEKTLCSNWKMTDLEKFAKKLNPEDEVAVEATGNTRYFCEVIRKYVKRVVVVNPSQFKVVSQSVKKTDKNDAELLALFLEKNMLPEVRVKGKPEEQIASLARTRDRLVKTRTALKNQINNILAAHGKEVGRESTASEKGLAAVLAMKFDEIVEVELLVIVEQIRSLNEGIRKLENLLKDKGGKLEGHENITSIKGIGDTSAGILLSAIGNVRDFANEGKLAAYLGIVPRVSQSADSERVGRITKRGNKLARTALVQCTLVAKRYSPYLNKHYERIKKTRGSGKAIIATARKLLGIIYNTLKNKWVFEDFPNFVIRPATTASSATAGSFGPRSARGGGFGKKRGTACAVPT